MGSQQDESEARAEAAGDGVSKATDDQLWWIDRSWEEVPPIVEQVNAMLAERIPMLYDRLAEEGVRPEVGEPVAVPRRGGGG